MSAGSPVPGPRLDPGTIADAASVALEHLPVEAEQVVAGSPTTGHLVLDDDGERTVGVWEMTVGAMRDVEADEVFVVLAGRASGSLAGIESVARAGDAIVVPPDTDFALATAGSEELQLVCCLPVGGEAVTPDATFTPPWAR